MPCSSPHDWFWCHKSTNNQSHFIYTHIHTEIPIEGLLAMKFYAFSDLPEIKMCIFYEPNNNNNNNSSSYSFLHATYTHQNTIDMFNIVLKRIKTGDHRGMLLWITVLKVTCIEWWWCVVNVNGGGRATTSAVAMAFQCHFFRFKWMKGKENILFITLQELNNTH